MGKLAVYKYCSFLFLIATFIVAGFTFFGLFGGHVPPAGNTAKAMLVYILPLLIAADAVLLLYWLLRRRWHWAAIPFVTILCCIPYIGTIYQFGSIDESADKKTGLKIATYNVALFGRETSGFKALDILAEMKREGVDILCMQEYLDTSGDKINSNNYKDYFPHFCFGRSDMIIYSRYPIERHDIIDFGPTNNSGMWADINVNGHIVRVFNVHLETTGFNGTMHRIAKMEIKGQSVEDNTIINAIYGSYTRGMAVRARQADLMANEIQASEYPAIVCGDFNDIPYSYVYNTMLGDLVDGFKECGNGLMYTFTGKKIVRIDYIFHDERLKGETYYKINLTYSDHYPVFMKLIF